MYMKYDNMSRTELVQLLKKRNETIEILENKEAVLRKKLENYSDSNLQKLMNDLKKQRKVQAEIINDLRRGRAELLRLITELTTKIQKGGV
nr:MAG TPA: Rab11 GTPase, Rab11 Family Interacting transport, Rab11a, FIP3, cytokinesis [Caudoviricetes sp.]